MHEETDEDAKGAMEDGNMMGTGVSVDMSTLKKAHLCHECGKCSYNAISVSKVPFSLCRMVCQCTVS